MEEGSALRLLRRRPKISPRSYPRGDEGGMELGKEFPEDSLERFLLEPLIGGSYLRLGLGVSY